LLDELIDGKAFDELPSRQRFVLELAARTERLPPTIGAASGGAAAIPESGRIQGGARRPYRGLR